MLFRANIFSCFIFLRLIMIMIAFYHLFLSLNWAYVTSCACVDHLLVLFSQSILIYTIHFFSLQAMRTVSHIVLSETSLLIMYLLILSTVSIFLEIARSSPSNKAEFSTFSYKDLKVLLPAIYPIYLQCFGRAARHLKHSTYAPIGLSSYCMSSA